MKKQNTTPKPAPKTFSEAMSEINWGQNNARLQPSADRGTHFAGMLRSAIKLGAGPKTPKKD